MPFQRSSFEPHPEGPTTLTFVDFADEKGQYGPQTRCSFDSEEEMEDGRKFRVSYWITDQFNPRSNSYKFLKAMGVDVDNINDEELAAIELDDFLKKRCQGIIEHVKRQDGTTAAKVTNLLPLKPKRTARPEASEPAEERELVGAGAGARGGKSAAEWEKDE